ncbi:MAG: hypothetical protein LBN37_00510, partial [Bacteroidales bacterium]|nr:hypothetical protein [Bacteroidales bacterium]
MKPQKPTNQQNTQKSTPVAPQDLSARVGNLLNNKIVQGILLLIITLVFRSNFTAIFDEKINLGGDNIVYFSCAQAIADGKGYTNTMYFDETPQTHFPPGYSVFIAALQPFFPNDIIAVKMANGVLLWLSLILLFLLVKRITGNTIVAFCSALFSSIQSSILSFATIMMSEMLYIFLSLLVIHIAIYLNEKLFLKKGRWKPQLLLVVLLLLIAYVYLVRSMGISLILALILWFGILALQSFIHFRKQKEDTENENLRTTRTWLIQKTLVFVLVAVSFCTVNILWGIRQSNAGIAESSYKSSFYK